LIRPKIQTNKVFRHLDNSTAKIVVEQGGTRSGKTYNILLWIIFKYCSLNNNKVITICRKSFPSLRATVMRDFITILQEYNCYSEVAHNKSNSEYSLFGNLVEFISLDQPQKIRGRKRDLLFVNEGNELYYEDMQQLLFRTQDRIILDFNPSDEFHWIYDKLITRDDCDFFKTTYLDNPFIEESIIKEIELLKDTDEQYWQIYGLGERSASRSTIFQYVEVNVIPDEAYLLSYGMDFGYSNDPSSLVSIYIWGNNMYVKEHLYRTQMTTNDIASFLRNEKLESNPIYADSAEPRLIAELRRMGFNIFPSTKGKDSINAGIDLLKRYKLHVLKDSTNAIMEFRNYKWKEDKSGMLLNIPEDKNNHIIDPCRYAAYSILSKPNFGKYALH
jgi:phage terminase large subunit|tara:strand:- start:6030 stop:7193 length:1164 start_codon:yes stop_codon:yes gene_type:complete